MGKIKRKREICPIETPYKGYLFRSRLEARWAVFFDKRGIDFRYEYEGYELSSGKYLPDFWLPQVKMWAEVKPTEFDKREYSLLYELSEITGSPCIMLVDEPDSKPYRFVHWCEYPDETGKLIGADFGFYCSLVSTYLEEGHFYYHNETRDWQKEILNEIEYGYDYKKAVNAARRERFGT